MRYFIGNEKLTESENYSLCTLSYCLSELNKLSEIELDTETRGLCPHLNNLICIQLGNNENQFVVEFAFLKPEDILDLKTLLESDRLFILQNAKFDLKFFYNIGIFIKNIYDTMLVEMVLTCGLDISASLYNLCKKYLNIELDKSVRTNIHNEMLTDRVIVYAAEDVKYLGVIKKKQLEIAEKENLLDVINLENEVVKVFALMEYNGIEINQEIIKDIHLTTSNEIAETVIVLDDIVKAEPKLDKYVPKTKQLNMFDFETRDLNINWASAKQKLNIVNDLGFAITSTDAKTLQKNKNNHDIFSNLLSFNALNKLNSSFGLNLLTFVNKKTNRIHPEYKQILDTGRIAVKQPNVNQIPSKGKLAPLMRSAFKAKKGYKFVGGDYSGMELCIIANFSNDKLWIDTLNNGGDLHSVLCSQTFNIPLENVKKPFPFNPKMSYRDVQKTINFGLAYGMSEFKLSETLNISVEDAKNIINSFFKKVPGVKKFLKKLANYGVSNGFIITPPPYNRKRYFEFWYKGFEKDEFKLKGEIERRSMNTPIQGCNADIIKQALINVQKEIDTNNWPVNILMSVYDEINTECKEDVAEQWKSTLENIMVTTAKKVITRVPIKADCYIADYWKK